MITKTNKNILLWYWHFLYYIFMPLLLAALFLPVDLFHWLCQYKSLIFWMGAFLFNAIMDCIESEHIKETIFDSLSEKFWSKRVGWNLVPNIFGYPINAWHLCKSAMIVCLIFSALFYKAIFGFWQDFIFYGLIGIHVFNGFYSHLFSTKK